MFVEQPIVQEFLDRFAAATNELVVGMPWKEGVFVTPMAEKGKTDYLKDLVSDAVDKGACIVNNGGARCLRQLLFPGNLISGHSQNEGLS